MDIHSVGYLEAFQSKHICSKHSLHNCTKYISELPKMSAPFTLTGTTNTSLSISFPPWSVGQGETGPVVSYKVEKQQKGSGDWELIVDLEEAEMLETTVTNLLRGTEYRFLRRLVPLKLKFSNFLFF